MRSKKGFTLAEVLVTLTVIGVVAALTIPSLVNNIGDQQTKTAWKKAFGDLSQATMRIMTENGSLTFSNNTMMSTAYGNYMNAIKTCADGAAIGNCWPSGGKKLDGTAVTEDDRASIILNNGVMLKFSSGTTDGLTGAVGTIKVDVNGVATPNKYGKDEFAAHVTPSGLVPYGAQGDGQDCTTDGLGCSSVNLYQ